LRTKIAFLAVMNYLISLERNFILDCSIEEQHLNSQF